MEKNSNKRKKKIILTIVTFLLGAGLVLGGLALWSGGFIAGSALIIVGLISVVISFITFRKSKYYCTNCGAELVSTGRYHETGDFETSHTDTSSTLYEHIEYEYECPHCHHKTVISKKEKIASHRY